MRRYGCVCMQACGFVSRDMYVSESLCEPV